MQERCQVGLFCKKKKFSLSLFFLPPCLFYFHTLGFPGTAEAAAPAAEQRRSNAVHVSTLALPSHESTGPTCSGGVHDPQVVHQIRFSQMTSG